MNFRKERKKLLISRQKREGGKSLCKKKKRNSYHRVINNDILETTTVESNQGPKESKRRGSTRYSRVVTFRSLAGTMNTCRGEGSGCNNNDTPATWKITSLWVAYGLVRGTAARTAAAAKLEQLNRGGAIRFTGELTPAAHCGSALIEIERLPYPPSIPSAILAISEVDCVTTHHPPPFQACSNPSTPSYRLITPAQSEEVKKLTPRFNRRFINYARIEV